MELFDIVDEYGNPTGETVERSVAHANGFRHRTAHIWIAREIEGKRQVLLQKRALTEDMTHHPQGIYRREMSR